MTSSPNERRRDLHRTTLIEVGLQLQKYYGTAYATGYLADVNIPPMTIERVLSTGSLRQAPPRPAEPLKP